MTGAQRKAHLVYWIVLVPLLVLGVAAAISAMREPPLAGVDDAPALAPGDGEDQ